MRNTREKRQTKRITAATMGSEKSLMEKSERESIGWRTCVSTKRREAAARMHMARSKRVRVEK